MGMSGSSFGGGNSFGGGSNSFGGISQLLGGIFGNSGAPYEKAGNEYEKYGQQAQQQQQPYYNAGVNALPKYQNSLDKMSNPTDFINNLMTNYKQSPYAKFLTDQGTRAATNAASASGLVGSTPYAQGIADYSQNIAGQDMNSWLQNVLGVNNQYNEGQKGLINGGQQAGNSLSELFSKLGEQMGGAAYGQQAGESQDKNNIFGGILDMLKNRIFG